MRGIYSKKLSADVFEINAIRGTALVKLIDEGLVNLITVFFSFLKRLKFPRFYVLKITIISSSLVSRIFDIVVDIYHEKYVPS